MPIGTDIRQGAPGFPQWVYALGDQFGVEGSTYPGHQEKSGYNRGIDWWPKGHADMSGASYSDAERSTLDRFASAMASAGAPTAQVSGGHVTNDGTGEAPAAWGGGGGGSGQIFNASVSSAAVAGLVAWAVVVRVRAAVVR
jgi:hypothetical protein